MASQSVGGVKLDDWDDDQVLIGRIRPRGKSLAHLCMLTEAVK